MLSVVCMLSKYAMAYSVLHTATQEVSVAAPPVHRCAHIALQPYTHIVVAVSAATAAAVICGRIIFSLLYRLFLSRHFGDSRILLVH